MSQKNEAVNTPAQAGAPEAAGGRAGTPRSKGLGKLTKFADTFREVTDAETGSVTRFAAGFDKKTGVQTATLAYDPDAVELERWLLKAAARRLLYRVEDRQKRKKRALVDDFGNEITKLAPVRSHPGDFGVTDEHKKAAVFRVINCTRDRISSKALPEIWQAKETHRCSFHKLVACGSVWTCPTCSRRINLARRDQIATAYNLFIDSKAPVNPANPAIKNADALLITFTIKHGIGDDAGELFSKLKEADRRFLQKSYAYKKLVGYTRTIKGERVKVQSPLSYLGRISTSEITHGEHGWHPHLHQLWFFDRRLSDREIKKIREELFQAWRESCLAAGLPAPLEKLVIRGQTKYVGVDVRRALSAEEYMSKFGVERSWGTENEMASSHVKTSAKGRSPFQLLHDYAQGCEASGKLFKVYAYATQGKHQVEFSKGLRKRLEELGIKDLLDASDEELASTLEENSQLLGQLTDADFQALNQVEKLGIEGHGTLLAMCKAAGFDTAIGWLRSLPVFHEGYNESTQKPFAAEWADKRAIADENKKRLRERKRPLSSIFAHMQD